MLNKTDTELFAMITSSSDISKLVFQVTDVYVKLVAGQKRTWYKLTWKVNGKDYWISSSRVDLFWW